MKRIILALFVIMFTTAAYAATDCENREMRSCMNSYSSKRQAESLYMTQSEYCAYVAIQACK